MSQLQAALKQRQLYDGPLDGTYGTTLRAAIEAYEKAEGMPVTGLATEALLKQLQDTTFKGHPVKMRSRGKDGKRVVTTLSGEAKAAT